MDRFHRKPGHGIPAPFHPCCAGRGACLAAVCGKEYRIAMCYSAMVEQSLKRLMRLGEARADLPMFEDLFHRRAEGEDIELARALEANFLAPASAAERRIAEDIRAFRGTQAQKWETELFRQKKRLADAERSLAKRTTKKAEEDRRIAGHKIGWLLGKLAELQRSEPGPDAGRIFPFWFAPVLVEVDGERLIRADALPPAGAGQAGRHRPPLPRPVQRPPRQPRRLLEEPDRPAALRCACCNGFNGRGAATAEARAATRRAGAEPGAALRPSRRAALLIACHAGIAGSQPARRTSAPSPRSPTTPPRRWPPPATTAASSRSSPQNLGAWLAPKPNRADALRPARRPRAAVLCPRELAA
ncbi:MAG: hypothetical protein MZV70_63400 [Desulfobacterales bacterium]|nr:hypothetical protein [Desulfobacterales bacterium]